VCVWLFCDAVQQPRVSLAWSAFLRAQYRFPASVSCLLHLLLALIGYESALDSDFGCVVAIEEGGIDFNTSHLSTCRAQSYDNPVRRLGIVASRFPTIVPRSGMCEDSGSANRWSWCDEILRCGKPFVAE
jgi:hypothetical protein